MTIFWCPQIRERLEKVDMFSWNQSNITTNLKVAIDFTLLEPSAMNVVMWKCHVNDSTNGRYDMILGRDILTELWSNFKII